MYHAEVIYSPQSAMPAVLVGITSASQLSQKMELLAIDGTAEMTVTSQRAISFSRTCLQQTTSAATQEA